MTRINDGKGLMRAWITTRQTCGVTLAHSTTKRLHAVIMARSAGWARRNYGLWQCATHKFSRARLEYLYKEENAS